jgi:hypothetical protein
MKYGGKTRKGGLCSGKKKPTKTKKTKGKGGY